MKNKLAFTLTVCLAAVALMLSLACCETVSEIIGKKSDYPERISRKLVSFTDCANAFSDSLEQIADRTYAPSDTQTEDIQNKLDALKKACDELAGEKAPAEYAEAQKALDAAMADYSDACVKCSALLEFYCAYDDLYRKYQNPADGSKEMEKKERALYGDFAEAMSKATASFRIACEKFDEVKTTNQSEE